MFLRPLPRFARKLNITFSPHRRPDALGEYDRAAARSIGVVAHVEDLHVPAVLLARREVVGLGLRDLESDYGDAVDQARIEDLPVGARRRRDELADDAGIGVFELLFEDQARGA